MARLIAKRLLASLVTLLIATIIAFGLLDALPGDFGSASLGRFSDPNSAVMIRENLGLYRPFPVRYLEWLSYAVEGDFGRSWSSGREVSELLRIRLGRTFVLASVASIIAVPLALAIGIFAAMYRDRWIDRTLSMSTLAAYSTPEFVLSYLLMFLLAVKLPLFPSIAVPPQSGAFWETAHGMGLPVITLCLAMLAQISRLTRAAIINVMSRPFIEMAELKGLSVSRIFIYHALPHTLGPVGNAVVLTMASLITGTLIVEVVFAFPGVGQLFIEAVRGRDAPVVLACGLAFTTTYVLLIMLADIIAIAGNPRLASDDVRARRLAGTVRSPRLIRRRRTMIAAAVVLAVVFVPQIPGQLAKFRVVQLDAPLGPADPPGATRSEITGADLWAEAYRGQGPVHNAYFLPVGEHSAARHRFGGVLEVESARLSAVRVRARIVRSFGTFPSFRLHFFTDGDQLVPTNRGLMRADDSRWGLMVSPGRIWYEPDDGGYSRASFPFTLMARYGQTFSGVGTFLFDDDSVSAVRVQIVQEAAAMAQFDIWTQLEATYSPGPGDAEAIAAYARERDSQIPIATLNDLEPGLEEAYLEKLDGNLRDPNKITQSGLIVDGVVYTRACRTRYGDFPYCEHMRHSVYSVSKSMGAMVALMRLAQKYGASVFEEHILDYVPIEAAHAGWERVTFADALNMATGVGDVEIRPLSTYVEEDNAQSSLLIDAAETVQEKFDLLSALGNYDWGPNEVFRYRTFDTFVLAAAMDALLKRREGPSAGVWKMLTEEVYAPLGIYHMPVVKTGDVPELGYGLAMTLDEVAKLAGLLQDLGRHHDQQILHRDKLAEALGFTMHTGLPTGWKTPAGETTYHLSLWQAQFDPDEDCRLRIPHMSGYGGNYVVLMPNGITAFRFADGRYNEFGTWGSSGLREAAHHVRPVC